MNAIKSNIEILLIEDNPNDAALIMRAMSKSNLANHIMHLDDGEDALDYLFCRGAFTENQFSHNTLRLIILDLKLPKLNGLEILKEIRDNKLTRKMPVVILTSSREDPDIKTAYDLGANSYIVKPLAFEEFFKVVTDLGFYWLMINKSPI
jgi:two-component system, response regulator